MKATIMACLICLVSFKGIAQNKDLNDSIIEQLKIGVEGFKKRYNSPSVVVAIIHENRVIFSHATGYIDLQQLIPATTASKYPILSITKLFTATMYMQLAASNKIKLDDDVLRYVPEYKRKSKGATRERTTLLQLATHNSGLPRNSPADIGFAKEIDRWILSNQPFDMISSATTEEFLESLQFVEREYPEFDLLDGNDRHYSNLGYSLLGTALERAAKNTFSDYVTLSICRPLKMNDTGFGTATFQNNILAKGYYYTESNQQFKPTPVYDPKSIVYAGGMYSTAEDLAKFLIFQFDEDYASKVLSPGDKRMMQNFGIGWKRSYPYLVHEGSMLGFRSEVVLHPQIKAGWVILTNATNFDFGKINDYISRLITPVYAQKPVVDISKFAGVYQLPGGYDSLKIYLNNGELYSSYLKDELIQTPLKMVGNNKFEAQGTKDYKLVYEFLVSEEGKVKFLNLNQLMWHRDQ